MTTRRGKKSRKMRGSHTHGWGAKKKHRGGGSRGGRGGCNLQKHKKSWMVMFDPNHFGKYGFKIPQKIEMRTKINAIKIRDIDVLATKMGVNEIDLSLFEYDKVISGGKLTRPLTIKARFFSKGAKEKIAEYGGKVVEG